MIVEAAPTRLPVEIRPPQPAELVACRRLLPDAFSLGIVPELLLAVSVAPFRFLGVLAYGLAVYQGRAAWRTRLHVARGSRRQGVGTALVAALRAKAAANQVGALIVLAEDTELDASPFLTALGFRHAFQSAAYRVELARYRALVEPLAERLHRAGKVPSEARVVAIQDAPPDGLSALLDDHARRTPQSLGMSWSEGRLRRSVQQASMVLMLDGDVIGAILAERHREVGDVAWRVVAPLHRGGWANVVLNAAVSQHMHRHGIRTLRFSTTSHTPDTERFVRLYGADFATRTDNYLLPLEASLA